MKIDVLGTEYFIDFVELNDADYDGLCDCTEKRIIIRSDNVSGVGNMKELQKVTMRHELIHAFMFESGLGFSWKHADEFGHDETAIDWFARQFEKLQKAFNEARAI